MSQVLNTLSDDAVTTLSAEARNALEGGDINALLELHRATFGGYRMDAGDGGDGGADGGDDAGDDNNDDGAGDDSGDDNNDDTDDGDDVDPKLKQARADAAKRRVQARENAAKAKAEAQRADAAEAELARLRKALGGQDDDGADKGDDDKTNADRERAEKAEAKVRELALRDAVRDHAETAKADAKALLDSRAFLQAVEGLDPTDDDYSTDVAEAIAEAIKTNPRLRAGHAPARSGSEFSGGSGEGAVTPEQFKAMNMRQRNELFSTNPTLYRKLANG